MTDSLPDELLEIILSHVNYVDLLRNCKLVSKKWLAVVNAMRFDELIVTGAFLYESYWYHSFRPVNMKNVLQIERSNFWAQSSFRNHFVRLKFLKRFSYNSTCAGDSECFFEHLSEFELLEHLEFGGLESPKKDHHLRLPNLRTLKIRTSPAYPDHRLIIDAGRLQVLHCYRLNFIQLVSRSSIRTLECICWKAFFRDQPDLHNYENLETLKIIDLHNSFNLSEIELSLPASLKRIHVNADCVKDDDLADDEPMEVESDVQDSYRESFKVWKRIIKLSFKQKPPELYFLNVRIDLDKATKFDDYEFRPTELDFYHRNYDALVETFPFFSRIDYDQLMSLWGRRLPADLFRRFNNIQKLTAKRAESPQHLLWFLGNCPLLTELDLYCPKFSQAAYDRLPSLCGRLTHFYLAEAIALPINYQFVRHFHALTLFSTSQSLPNRLALELVQRLKFLQDFIFNDQRGTVTISRIAGQFAFAYKMYEFDGSEWRSRQIIDYNGLSAAELGQLCSNYQLIQSL